MFHCVPSSRLKTVFCKLFHGIFIATNKILTNIFKTLDRVFYFLLEGWRLNFGDRMFKIGGCAFQICIRVL